MTRLVDREASFEKVVRLDQINVAYEFVEGQYRWYRQKKFRNDDRTELSSNPIHQSFPHTETEGMVEE